MLTLDRSRVVMPQQMRRGGLQVVIQFWLSDAKRVFFTHLDALVLLTILSKWLFRHSLLVQTPYRCGCLQLWL